MLFRVVRPPLSSLRSLLLASQRIALGGLSLELALASSLVLRPLGVHLLLDSTLTGLLSLSAVDLQGEEGRNVSYCFEVCGDKKEREEDKRTCSTRARLCLKVLPLLEWYSSW